MEDSGTSGKLYVARRASDCRVLGPGLRAVVWFHGCSRGCSGCIASDMNHSSHYEIVSANELYEWIRECDDIEGITLSGGEPFEQDSQSMEEFLRMVRSDNRNLSVITFTGYRLEELETSGKTSLLNYMDVLIDGPYIDAQNDNTALRGSDNQRIIFLSSRYIDMRDSFSGDNCRNIEIKLGLDNRLVLNGIPKRGFVKQFRQLMEERGYHLEFSK